MTKDFEGKPRSGAAVIQSVCPGCGYANTCTCWWWASLQPGGKNEHLRARAVLAMRTGVHEHPCPCPDCVAEHDELMAMRWPR